MLDEHRSTRPGRSALRAIGCLLILLVVFPTSGCRTTSQSSPFITYSSVRAPDVIAPVEVGHLRRRQIQEVPDAALGVAIRYVDTALPDLRIDVYLYPISIHPRVSLDNFLSMSMASLIDEMDEVGRMQGFRYGAPEIVAFPATGEPAGLLVRRDVETADPSDQLRSYGFLAIRDGTLWKLRVTGALGDLGEADAYVESVLAALFFSVRVLPSARPTIELRAMAMRDAFEAAAGNSCALGALIVYGFYMMQELEAGRFVDTFDRERTVRKGMADGWRRLKSDPENGNACESAGLDAMIAAEDAGFFDEYVFTAYAASWWQAPSDLRIDAFADWANATLPVHDPLIYPGVNIVRKDENSETSESAASPDARLE